MQQEGIDVHLGDAKYRVVPQGIGRIERKLRPILQVLGAASGDGETSVSDLDPEVIYEAVQVFIPDIMPLWRFRGYVSKEALERVTHGEPQEGDLDDPGYQEVTVPQIEDALDAIFRVNGGDRLARFFGRFVRPEVLQTTISAALAGWASSISPGSQNSPPTNGASDPTSSTTRVPISPEGSMPDPDLSITS